MPKKKQKQDHERMIHIRLSEEVHRRLRMRAAELDTTIQRWVAETVVRELDRQEKKKRGRT